jgi:hypothetical protein
VLRDLWLSEAEPADEGVHGQLAPGKQVEDLPPPGLRDRVEGVRRGRRSCHAEE